MDLSLLGLPAYEEKAYLAAVEHGISTAAEISRHSGVPYGRIYDVLASLEEKGLIKVVPEPTKKYIATDPKQLSALVEKQKKALAKLEDDIIHLKKIYETAAPEPVQIVRGKRNFYRLLKSMSKEKQFDYSIRYTAEYNPEWVRSTKEKLEKGVDMKIMVRADKETMPNIKKWQKLLPIKEMQNEGVAIGISDTGVIMALINSNTSVLIQDTAFIALMKELYLAKYDKAPEIQP